jgi:transposase-like protein
MIYTTNAVESLNRSLRKIIKTRGSFPTDDGRRRSRRQGVHAVVIAGGRELVNARAAFLDRFVAVALHH